MVIKHCAFTQLWWHVLKCSAPLTFAVAAYDQFLVADTFQRDQVPQGEPSDMRPLAFLGAKDKRESVLHAFAC